MNGRSFPTGQANIGLLKALYRTLASEKSTAAADAWLRTIRMLRADFADETRALPLSGLHRALIAFAESASREAIPHAWKHLVAPDSLGVWVRVLRGTTEPAEAFARLDTADSQYGRTTRWETTETRRGWWRGRVSVGHDPALEADGLLRLARLAELAAVPALFGYPGAVARHMPADGATGRSRADEMGLVQWYEVAWSVPDVMSSGGAGAAIGLTAGLVPLAINAGSLGAYALAAGLGCAVGALGGIVRARDQLRRAESHAQQTRVHALERNLSLKEAHEGGAGSNLEGTVAAGQYRIVRRMGAGSTGVIYEAVRMSDGQPVALKLLRAAAAHDAVASDRLRREAEALGLSWHPNVVEVIDHGHLPDGTAYLVMELLPGESLATRLLRGRLTPGELLPIALQMCDALSAVHAAGVVHRDVKPSNILLAVDRDAPTGPERVKLLDFGIARVEWEETRITNTGGPLGTPGYMSPEQEMGEGEVDGRSDLFALGAVLFECLVGEPPPPRTPSGLHRMGAASSPPRVDSGTQKAAAVIPPRWRAVIDKAMAVNPADRYSDARSFAQDLRAAGEDRIEASS
jgi:Protein kinase domain